MTIMTEGSGAEAPPQHPANGAPQHHAPVGSAQHQAAGPPPGGADHPAASQTAGPAKTNNGRDKIHWTKDVWDRIDRAVHDEMMRTRVAQKFLPIRPVIAHTTAVPFDSIAPPDQNSQAFSVDEGLTTRLNEYWVEFSLTPQQVDHETGDLRQFGHSTAATLATHAANILAQAEDLVIFQGANAIAQALFSPPGKAGTTPPPSVLSRGAPLDTGLLDLPAVPGAPGPPAQLTPLVQAVPVKLLDAKAPGVYGSNTFGAVAKAYATLQGAGQYGPYALVLQTTPYADTYAPVVGGTLVITADRIHPLMTAGFYGAGTLPQNTPATSLSGGANASYVGVLVSLGGNTMDLVVGLDATTAFMQQDPNGNYRFRVVERFALRLKDTTGVIRLEFQ
jgi:uncharacterized linocin/CFP29 family protein